MEYIIIQKCTSRGAWYADKIGQIFKKDKDRVMHDVYTVKVSKRKDRANYGFVDHEDAKEIGLSFTEKIKLAFGLLHKQ
jgi:hypothetical protein